MLHRNVKFFFGPNLTEVMLWTEPNPTEIIWFGPILNRNRQFFYLKIYIRYKIKNYKISIKVM